MRVLVRSIPDSFVDAVSPDPRRINIPKARKQHAAYVKGLQTLGGEVTVVDADEAHPDCVFVEDQAIVLTGHALITRAGHASRRGEAGPIRDALATLGLTIHEMAEPATLDGGDVLRVDKTLYVGRSGRTNSGGILALMQCFGPLGFGVVPVDVSVHNAQGYLHLKSMCSSPVDGLVLVAPDTLDPGRFEATHVIVVGDDEAHACNAVGIGRSVLIPGGCPNTAAALKEQGFGVIEVGTSEVRKADGALSCCSLIFS